MNPMVKSSACQLVQFSVYHQYHIQFERFRQELSVGLAIVVEGSATMTKLL